MLVLTECFLFKGRTVISSELLQYQSGLIGILEWTDHITHINIPSTGFDMIGSKYGLCKINF